jgi:serine/threonine-protein kinase
VKVLTEPAPPLEEKRPELPRDLVAVIDRCLSKEPADRFADVGELAAALEPFAPSVTGSAERVLTVLHSPPQSIPPAPIDPGSELGETRTAGSFDTGGDKAKKRSMIIVAASVAAGVLLVGGTIVVFASRSQRVDTAPQQTISISTTTNLPPPLQTTVEIPTIEATALPPSSATSKVLPTSSGTSKHVTKKPDAGVNPSQRF